MKIIFLIPPSEGKNRESIYNYEDLSFNFPKPLEIIKNATEKDLKCKDSRFLEATKLNNSISETKTIEAIKRYSGVMYNEIDYENMSKNGKTFFENNFLILSGLYGILKANDKIVNYKLPIEAKGLYKFWWDLIPEKLAKLNPDFIVNLLPISYAKLLGLSTNCNRHKKKLEKFGENTKIININFLKPDGKKISHGVKKIKGAWIKNICENGIKDYKNFSQKIIENGNIIDINITI